MPSDRLSPIVTWFKSRTNSAIFFVLMLAAGLTLGWTGVFASKVPEYGDASLACVQSQPKGEFHRATEFFLLTCPYCEKLESYLPLIKDGVIRRHVIWDRSHEEMARFVFALERVGRQDLIHAAELAVLDNKGVFIRDTDDYQAFVTKHKLDGRRLNLWRDSPAANQFIIETRQMQEFCEINSAPVLMRAGKLHGIKGADGYLAAIAAVSTPSAPPVETVVCTMDAKICPDGEWVGRTFPNCEFAPCSPSKK